MTSVRPGRAADLEAVVALDAALFGDEAWDLAGWQGLVATGGRRLLVAASSNAVVGYALTGVGGDLAELLRIGADPAHRRRGVASRLLERACAEAGADGADRLLLEVSEANSGARAFYESAGFATIDRRPGYYRDGSAALVLERALVTGAHVPERMDP